MENYKITLSNGKQIPAYDGKTILEAARQSQCVLNYSCNNGQCGVCRCSLISGEVDNSNDTFHSKEEINQKQILTCQAIPLSDIEIDVEDLGIYSNYPSKTIPARISTINEIAEDILRITFRTPPNNKLSFLPGQYVDLINGEIRRSYSVANSQRKDGSFDLLVKRVEGGEMSNILFGSSKQNDLFRIEGPLGTFGWRASTKKNVVFLVTGTGIAPALSMIGDCNTDIQDIYVIWGNRFKREFFEMPDIFNSLNLIKTLSRDTGIGFETGYVQDVLISLKLKLEDTVIYACGSESMILSSRPELFKQGLDQKSFYSDSFVSTGR